MAIWRMACKRETLVPLLALVFATLVCFVLVMTRIARTGSIKYTFLLWNLFLAWVPLVLALLACHSSGRDSGRTWRVAGFGLTWLLFFPNSPYIFTDVVHLTSSFYRYFWIDLVLILSCAFTGLVVGFVSLYLMHSVVKRGWGSAAGWLFVGSVAALSGVGVHVGRFLRFNSWDVLFRPLELARNLGHWASNPHAQPTLAFPVFFALFLLICYTMLYALTHLKAPAMEATPAS